MTRALILEFVEGRSGPFEMFFVAANMRSWTGDVRVVIDNWIENANLTDCNSIGPEALGLLLHIREDLEKMDKVIFDHLLEIGYVAEIEDSESEESA